MAKRDAGSLLALIALLTPLLGCGTERPPPAPPGLAAASPPVARPDLTAPPATTPLLPAQELDEKDLAAMRDPFQPAPPPAPLPPPQHDVVAPDSALDELSLIGIVTGDSPRAMLADREGKGWVVKAGDRLGKPDPSGATWRVDRIRGTDIVLLREDTTTTPLQTRILSLHPKVSRR